MECPACDNQYGFELLEGSEETSLYQCVMCDVQFWHPVNSMDNRWYEEDIYYSLVYTLRNYLIPETLHKKYWLFLKNTFIAKGRLLDVGCGSGKFAAKCRDNGFNVVAIDFNQKSIDAARRNWKLDDVYSMSFEEYGNSYPHERFDAITLFEVLEHQEKAAYFLESVRAMLQPGGYVALSVPNRERWGLLPPMNDCPPNHLTRWSRDSLMNVLTRGGFSVVEIREIPLTMQSARQVISGRFNAFRNRLLFWGLERASENEDLDNRGEQRWLFHALFISWRIAVMPFALAICAYARLFSRKDYSIYCLAKSVN